MKTRMEARAFARTGRVAVRCVGALLAVSAITATELAAQRSPPGGGEGVQMAAQRFWGLAVGNMDSLASSLKLTAAQREALGGKLRDIRGEHGEALRRHRAYVAEMRELLGETGRGDADRSRLREVAEKHGHPARELGPVFLGLLSDARELLEPDQLPLLRSLLAPNRGRTPG